jgi:hypothetical protein
MPIILAVEPDHKQAAQLAAIVRNRVRAELVIGDTTERALDQLGARVPDMVLVPALLSPQDDAALAAALRVIAAAAHVRTLTIPVLASGTANTARGGLLSRWRRGRAESPTPDGCDPAVFAEQITAYLQEAAAERAEMDETPKSAVAIARQESVETLAPFEAAPFEAPFEAAPFEATAPVEAMTVGETSGEMAQVQEPVIDLSDELLSLSDAPVARSVALSVDAEENLFAGEPFGTYTLPSMEEIGPEAQVALEASAAPEAPVVPEPAIAFESPVAFESPAAFESPVAVVPPVAFDESPAAFESPVAFESLDAIESPDALEPPIAVEPPVVFEYPLAFEPPVAFEHPAVLELMAPMPLQPWRVWPPLEGVPIEVPGIAAAKQDVPEWSELMASLRQDMARRRGQERPPVLREKHAKAAKPLVDEWGFFDPEQCGFSALLAKLDEITSA